MERIVNVSKKVARFFKNLRPTCFCAGVTEDDGSFEPERTSSGSIIVTRIASCSLAEGQLIGVKAAPLEAANENFTIPAKGMGRDEKNEIDEFVAALVAGQKRIQEKLWSPRTRKVRWERAFAARYRRYDMLEKKFGEEFIRRVDRNVYGD